MKFLIFVALVSCVAPAYYECDWVPTIGCGGSIHVCELRATVAWGAFDREEAEGLVIYHKKINKLLGTPIRRAGDFGENCSFNLHTGPFVQGKNFCCKLFL
ncbi:hypothetical protein GCK72_011778 [Caenorhabditis remanei]|uniref:Uncharacterized protein n=1 Tax=Caenorhabditis remanei TaxID=31234 RepID=A0A6A5HAW5_CAERE|nr:hypothetical protein GCK72_011778 [Caenorhabditis remanei]KAF1763512.1 hypothetical protein GCK72_011778 [Caenorhabditis remanei]